MDSAEIRFFLSHSTENFSKMVFECPEMEGFIESALDDTGKREKRKRSLAASFVVKFVRAMMLFRNLSIVNIMRKFIHIFRKFFRELTLISITPEALCHARKRLGFEVLRILFEYIAAMVRPLAKFHNFPVVGVDGTKLNVPDTKANADFFGRPNVARDEAAHPRMEVITLVNTSTRQLTGVEIMPCNSSERDGFLKLFDKLPEKALVLMDRGFPAQLLLELLLDFSKHFVVRNFRQLETRIPEKAWRWRYAGGGAGENPQGKAKRQQNYRENGLEETSISNRRWQAGEPPD